MRTTLLLSMILFCRILCGQSLQGFVYDRELQEPIPGVAVYLDGTTGYAVTDDRGWYELSVSRRFQTPLVFQHLTYETVILHDPYSQLPDTLFLCEKTNWIDRITITPARFSRKEMLKSFRTIFLGESKAGKSCRITNEEDIVLFYDAQKEALIAAADRPLCIENRHLGYRVWFNLQTFQADFFQTSLRPIDVTRTVILGTTFFQDLVRANASRYIIRRWQAYDNSAAELFRALRENNLRESRFLVGLNPLQAHRNPLETVTGSAASKHAVSVTAYRSAPLQIIEDIRESGFSLRDSLSLKVLTIEREPVLRSYAGEETPERVYAQLTIRYHFSDRGNDLQTRSSRSDIYFLDSTFLIDAFGNFGPIDRVVITGAMSKKGWEICCLPIMNRATGLFPEPPHPGLFPIV